MKQSLKLGTISRVPVYVHWSFSLIIAYLIYEGWSEGQDAVGIAWMIGFVLVIFVCVFLHELGHVFAARRYGIGTEDITILPIGGLARLQGMPKKPLQEMVVAIMGPMVNVIIAILLVLFFWLTPYSFVGLEELALSGEINASNFLSLLIIANIVLVVFNCIPAFPMDGGRVFRALLAIPFSRVLATRIASLVGQAFAIGFVVFYFMNTGESPFILLIALFIFFAAGNEYRMVKADHVLNNRTVGDVMQTNPAILSAETPLRDVKDTIKKNTNEFYLVDSRVSDYERDIIGITSKKIILKALQSVKDLVTIGAVVNPELYRLEPGDGLKKVYIRMLQTRVLAMPVYEDNNLVGLIDFYQIRKLLRGRIF